MIKYPYAAKGIKLLFVSELINIAATIISNFPTLEIFGNVILIISLLIAFAGIYIARQDRMTGYTGAMNLTFASIVIAVLQLVIDTNSVNVTNAIIATVSTISIYGSIYFVCTATSKLLRDVNNFSTADLGLKVWHLMKIFLILSIFCCVFMFIAIFNSTLLKILTIGMIVMIVLSVISSIMYLVFLNKSSKSLSIPSSDFDANGNLCI